MGSWWRHPPLPPYIEGDSLRSKAKHVEMQLCWHHGSRKRCGMKQMKMEEPTSKAEKVKPPSQQSWKCLCWCHNEEGRWRCGSNDLYRRRGDRGEGGISSTGRQGAWEGGNLSIMVFAMMSHLHRRWGDYVWRVEPTRELWTHESQVDVRHEHRLLQGSR